jgi:hypothetical protein
LHRHSSIAAGRRRPRCRGFGSESTDLYDLISRPIKPRRRNRCIQKRLAPF